MFREGEVQSRRVSRGDPGTGEGMCVPGLRTGRLTGLEARDSMELSGNGKGALGQAGETGKVFTI